MLISIMNKMTLSEYQYFMMDLVNGLVAVNKSSTLENWDADRDAYFESKGIDPSTQSFITFGDVQ